MASWGMTASYFAKTFASKQFKDWVKKPGGKKDFKDKLMYSLGEKIKPSESVKERTS